MESDGIKKFSHEDYVETWKAMEKADKADLTKSVEISKEQMEKILKRAEVVPGTDQMNSHPYLKQKKLIEFGKSEEVKVTGSSPLEDLKDMDIVEKYKKTPAEVVVHYPIGGENVFPKLATNSGIEENFNLFELNLPLENIKLGDTFEFTGKICPNDE